MAHKICPRCGVVFEVKDDPVFCSAKCKSLFQQSSLDYIKRGSGYVGRKPKKEMIGEI